MISMNFVNKMNHTHNQAIQAIQANYKPGIDIDDLLKKSASFIDDNVDTGVFRRELQKMLNARGRNNG